MNRNNFRPLLTLWVKPRETTRNILDTNQSKFYMWLVVLSGILGALSSSSVNGYGDGHSLVFIFGMAIFFGSILGILSWYIGSLLVYWTGTWIGGGASRNELKVVYGWSNFYVWVSILLWIVDGLTYGQLLFKSEGNPADAFGLTGFLDTVIGIWAFVVLVKMVAEAQRFSAWKALGNILLAMLVIIVPLAILGIIIALIFLV